VRKGVRVRERERVRGGGREDAVLRLLRLRVARVRERLHPNKIFSEIFFLPTWAIPRPRYQRAAKPNRFALYQR